MHSSLTKNDLLPCVRCVCFNIRKATRIITQYFDETMQASGLRSTQFTILVIIAGKKALTISELANKLSMDRTTLTRNLNPLKNDKLLELSSGNDRRTRFVHLTKKGEKKLKQALPLWRKAQKSIKTDFGEKRFKFLLAELNSVEKLVSQL